MVLHSNDHYAIERGVRLPVTAAIESVPGSHPEDAGIGATPQSLANAASERIRSGLSPATMSISDAVSGPDREGLREIRGQLARSVH